MLQSANQKYERESSQFARPPSRSQTSPTRTAPQPTLTSFAKAGERYPLKPASPSTLNGSAAPRKTSASVIGTKRTASGLAKAMTGSFGDSPGSQERPFVIDDLSPARRTGQPIISFGENDFDSDVDLDVEEPVAKVATNYPTLPTKTPSSHSALALGYPKLQSTPRTLKPSTRGMSTALDPSRGAYGPSPEQQAFESSASIAWSSSPIEHHRPSKPAVSLQRFGFGAPDTAVSKSMPEQVNGLPKATKKRTIPWPVSDTPPVKDDDDGEAARDANHLKDATPIAKGAKPSQSFWNTTASAVKEQQKKHRDANKHAKMPTNDADDVVQKAKSANKRPARVFLSEEQQHVLTLVIEKKKSVFFTGSAGTGKSVLMREIISSLRKKFVREPDRVAVTASTGLAACNVGGVTLHSFAGIGLGKDDVPELVRKIKRNQKAKHRWMRTKILVVDEVSMVDGEMFDKLEAIARQIRNNARPFGGIQLVITGDFFQLPPVPDYNKVAKFAFDAATWKTSIEHTIGLHHVFRQRDPIFAGMLNEMREGRLTQSSINAFRNLSRPMNFEDSIDATELFPTRIEVDKANSGRLCILQGENMEFIARDGGSITDKLHRDKLLSNCMAPVSITLKKGAQVMLIKNIDEQLVNGSIGRVIGFMSEREFDSYTTTDGGFSQSPGGTLQGHNAAMDQDELKARLTDAYTTSNRWPLVRFGNADGTWRELLCQPESWKIELPSGEVQASRMQVPLILAWALSIHKAQGQTLARVKVDLGNVFEKGQAYVALSRATSMAGLQVLRFDPKKVMAHDRVRTFYSNLSRVELAEKNKERMASVKKSANTSAGSYESLFVNGEFDMEE